jgi:hypothetical protein
MVTFVVCDNDGFLTPGPSCMPSEISSIWSNALVCISTSRSFGTAVDVLFDVLAVVGAADFCGRGDSAAPGFEPAGAFLRVLNENFFGGLKELRLVCNFSARFLIF